MRSVHLQELDSISFYSTELHTCYSTSPCSLCLWCTALAGRFALDIASTVVISALIQLLSQHSGISLPSNYLYLHWSFSDFFFLPSYFHFQHGGWLSPFRHDLIVFPTCAPLPFTLRWIGETVFFLCWRTNFSQNFSLSSFLLGKKPLVYGIASDTAITAVTSLPQPHEGHL